MADVSKVKLNGTAYNVKDASVPSWAKQSSKPSYTQDEVGDGSTYKRVTSTEKSTWNNKGTYSKPSGGIPKSDLASAVQTSLEKADTALQSFTESDPTVPSWAKQSSKPSYTASEVGAIATSAKGAANGVASLDSAGKVPSSQLPSYVDDVLEYSAKSSFPSTGETGKIYVDTSTNKTYRWSGSAYVEISASLALGETSSTAYYGDKGKTAYNHSQVTSGNPHNVTKSDVGLGNVGNFKAVSTVANQGLSSTEKSNARTNIGAGTSSFSGSYNDLSNKPTIPTKVSQLTNDSGYTTNTGTVTGVKVGSTSYSPSSGVVSLPAYPTTLPASDVYSWAKASSKPSYTASEVGLGNVGNFKAVSTVASQGLSDTEKSNARANIGAGTSSFSGSYKDLSNKPTIPTKVSQLTNDSGYTTNTGTVTGVKVGSTSYSPSSGVVSLPAYPTTLPASDVYSWAKASSKPTYTASDVGVGNVGNFKAVSTVANQGLSSTEKSNARANIGAGTGNGTYSKPSGGIPKSDLASAVQTSLDRADTSLQHSTVTGSPDLNTYLTTGVYHIATQTATHAPSTNHGTLFVDATVGTPYQVFKPDVESVFYTRYYYQSSWTNWVGSMTGVKGNSETSYRTGNVNITKANIGLGSVGDFLAVSTAASQGLNKTQKVNARINIDLEPQEIAITAGTGFTVGTSFTYKCNNLAWFSIMIKVITALTGNQTYTCAYVDANTIKRGDSMVPLTAMQDDSFNRINAFFSQWSTQEIKIIPENDVPANAWIIVSGVYRFY